MKMVVVVMVWVCKFMCACLHLCGGGSSGGGGGGGDGGA